MDASSTLKSSKFSIVKKVGLILGPMFFLILFNWKGTLLTEAADPVLAVAAWMVIWWITESVSISVTALIPLTIFPLIGLADIKTVAANYGSPIVFLFFGGFVMALALEKVGLHKRIALTIVNYTGLSPNRIILGFMLATAFLSMWISNTATTVVMLPIALSVIELLKNDDDGFTKDDSNFALSIMLAIAFSANVGGVSTIIGTPPNTVMVGFVENTYGIQISFLQWMLIGVPFSLIMLVIIYFVLVKWIYPNQLSFREDTAVLIENELNKLGKIKGKELRVLWIFAATIFLWISRIYINRYFPSLNLSDTGISLLAAFCLFTLPFNYRTGEFTLVWNDTVKLPWGILILFGGGLALASSLSKAGVIDFIGQLVQNQSGVAMLLVISALIAIVLFMTELMSNVALVAIFCPVVAGIALGLDTSILHVLIPVTMAASCAFMLPMATPPNAIVFASGLIEVKQMARAGFILNLLSIMILILFAALFIPVFI